MATGQSDEPQVYLLGKTGLVNNQGQFYIKNDPIVYMASGDLHTIIVTKTGRAFAFGNNKSGQLGLGHTDNVEKVSCIKSLKFTEGEEKVILAACGRDSSLVATNHGSLYAFGSNSHSQLGVESKDSSGIRSTPIKIEGFKGKIKWKQIAMGAEHACALTDEGVVYVWGSNDDGQCGLERAMETIKTPKQIRVEGSVSFISCGYYNTAFVTDTGRLFVCGNNDDRQLGRSIAKNAARPEEVTLPNKVKAVACGNQHTVVLTENGEVYTCGHGDRGQLGLGSRILSAEKFELVAGLPKRISAIAAGEGHTVVVGHRGDMYVFGDGKHGKLGPSIHTNEFDPCVVEKFKPYNVLKVVCGGCQTIILAQKKSSDQKQSSESDEDLENQTLSVTQRQKSRARSMRNKTLSDRTRTTGDSMDATLQHTRPLGASNHLRTEYNDDDDDDNKSQNELSSSLKSATFNQTHTLSNGRFRPTQDPGLNRTTMRGSDDNFKPLKTGVLDRTARLRDTDDLGKTSSNLPSIDKSSARSTQLDRPSPQPVRKRDDSDEEKSPVRNTRFDRPSPLPARKRNDSDEEKSPVRNTRLDRPSPLPVRKRDDSDEEKSPVRNTRLDRPSPQPVRKRDDSDEEKSPVRNTRFDRPSPLPARKRNDSDEEKSPVRNTRFDRPSPQPARKRNDSDEEKSLSDEREKLSPIRNDPKRLPARQRKSDSDDDDDDDDYSKRSSPRKTPMSETLNRKLPQKGRLEDDDDDERASPRPSNGQKKAPPPVTRRGSLQNPTRTSTSVRDGNQTIGSRPTDGVRGSFRSQANKSLAKTNSASTKTEAPAAQQPGLFSRIFSRKPTTPPTAAPATSTTTTTTTTTEKPATNSRTCSIM